MPHRQPSSARYQLFPAMKPKGIDLESRYPDGRLYKLARGIYEVDELKLRLCLPSSPHIEPFKDRPSDFDPVAGRDLWVFFRAISIL